MAWAIPDRSKVYRTPLRNHWWTNRVGRSLYGNHRLAPRCHCSEPLRVDIRHRRKPWVAKPIPPSAVGHAPWCCSSAHGVFLKMLFVPEYAANGGRIWRIARETSLAWQVALHATCQLAFPFPAPGSCRCPEGGSANVGGWFDYIISPDLLGAQQRAGFETFFKSNRWLAGRKCRSHSYCIHVNVICSVVAA